MGVSILMIFVYHIILFYERYTGIGLPVIDELTAKGYIGVDIFMFLSAYGLSFSYEKNNLKRFYFHRFSRLYPMYGYFLCLLFLILYAFAEVHFSLSEIIWVSVFQFTGLAVFSFLNCEMEWFMPSLIILYVCFPLIFRLVKIIIRRYGSKGELFLILFSLLGGILMKGIIYENLAYRFPLIVTALIFYFRRDSLEHLFKLSIFCLICSVLTCRPLLENSMIIPVFMVVLCFLNISSFVCDNFLKFIGAHTLEIYLAQVITTKYIMNFRLSNNNILMEFIIVFVLTVFFSYILYITHFYSLKCFLRK